MKSAIIELGAEQVPQAAPRMRKGDTYTIEGVGIGSNGQTVIDGRNILTKRKCKAVKPAVFRVGEEPKQ